MKNDSTFLKSLIWLLLQNLMSPFRIIGTLAVCLLLSSCSYLQNDAAYNLDKQIERQQVQRELIAEPVTKEKRTVAEFEELGDRYLLAGDLNKAYIYYLKGLALAPDRGSIIHKQGILLLKKSKFVEAEAVYDKLLQMNSEDAAALEGRGRAYFGLGRYLEAEQDFLAALEVNYDQYQCHAFLGLIYSRRQQYDQAISRFKTALGYQPRNVSIGNNLAVSYYLNGDFKEAVQLYEELVQISTNRKIYNNLALAYFQLGFYDDAMNAFKRGSESVAVAYNNMGYEFLVNKKYKEAIEAFEKAIDLHPQFYPSAQKNLDIANRELSNVVTEVGK